MEFLVTGKKLPYSTNEHCNPVEYISSFHKNSVVWRLQQVNFGVMSSENKWWSLMGFWIFSKSHTLNIFLVNSYNFFFTLVWYIRIFYIYTNIIKIKVMIDISKQCSSIFMQHILWVTEFVWGPVPSDKHWSCWLQV